MNEEDLSEIMKKITSMLNSNNTDNNSSDNPSIPNNLENNSDSNNYSSNNSNDTNSSNTSNTNKDSNNFNNANENSNTSNNYDNSRNQNSDNSSGFNIDIQTLLKMKSIMDKMNNTQNDPRTNLLLSLKPYLKPDRKDKLDQYIKLLNMGNIIELFKSEDNSGGEGK